MSQLKQLTTERLAQILSEELEADGWGDIDPYWVQMVGDGDYDEDNDHHDDAEALGKVLDRVVARLKADFA